MFATITGLVYELVCVITQYYEFVILGAEA